MELGPYLSTYPVPAAWGGGPVSFTIGGDIDYDGPSSPSPVGWTASYSGDSIYAPSSASGSNNLVGCPPFSASGSPTAASSSDVHLKLKPHNRRFPATKLTSNSGNSTRAGLNLFGPKFRLPAAPSSALNQVSASTRSEAVTVCVQPVLPLVVTLQSASRAYGAPNPTLTYTVSGLQNTDTVTVTPSTTATVSSAPGSYPVTATVTGANLGNYGLTVNAATLTVTQSSVTLAGPATQPVTVSVNQAASIGITASGANAGAGIALPTGSISYTLLNSSNATVANATVALVAGSGDATASVPIAANLQPGAYTLNITYGGDINFAASPAPLTVAVVVGKITPAITWAAPSGITYGASLGAILDPTAANEATPVAGTFAYTATPAGGSATAITAGTILGAGNYTLTATFTPTDAATFGTATASVMLTIAKATPMLALASTANPVFVSNAVTLAATASFTAGAPTGTVSFYDGTNLLAMATLSSGVATYMTSTLAAGSHSLNVSYSGDTNFVAATSAALVQTVDDFSLAAGGSSGSCSLTASPGGTASCQLTFTPVGSSTFAAPISLAITGLPPGATATLSPTSIPANSGATTVTITIKAPAQTSSKLQPDSLSRSPWTVALGLLVLPFIGGLRKRFRKSIGICLGIALLAFSGATMLATLTGCGGSHSPQPPSPQTYALTLTATSGNLSHSLNLTLTVE